MTGATLIAPLEHDAPAVTPDWRRTYGLPG